MKVFEIDLYKEFNLTREDGAKGYLTAYLLENYQEVSINRKHPAMIVVGGGGYAVVSGREKESVVIKYLEKGYNCFLLDYSVAPLRYPTAHIEASMAVAYVRKNADALGVREDNVACVGFSAGGHLVGCLSTLFESDALNVLGENKKLVRPDASVMIYPVITFNDKAHLGSFKNLCGDNEKLMKELSIETCVNEKSVPCYIAHNYGDTVVPVKNSLLLASAYEDAGVPFSLHIFEKGNHGMSVNDITCDHTDNLIARKNGATRDYNSWVEESIIWLEERGFEIKD